MIILDNIIFELQKVGGISRYWSGLIRQYLDNKIEIEYLENINCKKNLYRKNLNINNITYENTTPLILKRILNSNKICEVFHSSYYRISKKASRNIVTIHDMMNEQRLSSKKDLVLKYIKKRACKNASKIISVSNFTKNEIVKYYNFIDPSNIVVVHHGIDEVFYPEVIYDEFYIKNLLLKPKEFFLYVGNRGYFKNFPYVISFIQKSQNYGIQYPLVLVGENLSQDELKFIKKNKLNLKKFIVIKNLDNSDLRKLYSNCFALLIPSLYEGFGFTAAEAARCKSIVISANNSALEEVVGKSKFSLSLKDKNEEFRILDNLNDTSLVLKEKQRIYNHSLKFNWKNSAKKMLDIYYEN